MLRFLLYPFAILYDVATTVRNMLYDTGRKPSASFDIPLIGVGNLAVGGTGKTPMVEYLIRLLHPPFRIATLSRGYGRSTGGFRIADRSDNPQTIGDEPYQLYKKFEGKVAVTVGEERALAVPMILDNFPDTEIILLDDAFQHRKVRPSFQILLSDFERPFYKDLLLPAGRLRESRKGSARADVIVVTKCPLDLSDESMMLIEDKIRLYAAKPVFFSAIRYGAPIGFAGASAAPADKMILVTGIANPSHLSAYAKQHFTIARHISYPDHHSYSASDLREIVSAATQAGADVLTTEKDAVKISRDAFSDIVGKARFFYLPIETEFLKNGKEFDEMVLNVVHPKHASS